MSYVDSEGAKHIVGLVKLKIEAGRSNGQKIGDAVEIQSLGISVYSTSIISGISVGYNREQITAVRVDLYERNRRQTVDEGEFTSMTKLIEIVLVTSNDIFRGLRRR